MEDYQNRSDGGKNDYALNNMFNPSDYLDVRLKPGEKIKTKRIRLLPVDATSTKFRADVSVHKLKVSKEISESGFKTFHCLNDVNNKRYSESVKCPLCTKSDSLLEEARKFPKGDERNKTLWKESKVYEPKKMDILRCIDRDDEAYGPKFCRFGNYGNGSGVFEMIMVLWNNRNDAAKRKGLGGYNMFDLHEGRDIVITIKLDPGKNGAPDKTVYTVDIDEDKTPLSVSEELIQKWVQDPKKWYDVYSCKPYDYLEVIADGKVPSYSKLLKRYVDNERKDELETMAENGQSMVQDRACHVVGDTDETSSLPF